MGSSQYPKIICQICKTRGSTGMRYKIPLVYHGWYRDGFIIPEDEREAVIQSAWDAHALRYHTRWQNNIRDTHAMRKARLAGLTHNWS